MKKAMIGIGAAGALLLAGTISTFAAGEGTGYSNTFQSRICNYMESDGTCSSFTGICHGQGTHYTDGDHDGVCDNYTSGICPRNGTGMPYGGHHARNR